MTTEHRDRPDDEGFVREAWGWFMIVGLAALAVHGLLKGSATQPYAYELIAGMAAVAVIVGIRLHQPRHTLAWNLLACAIATWVIGALISSANTRVFDSKPFPSAADVANLAGYPFLFSAIAIVSRIRARGRDLAAYADASTVALAVLVPSWIFLMAPVLADRS